MKEVSNKEISRTIKLFGQLLELHGTNPFKTKSYYNAAFQIGRFEKPLSNLSDSELSEINGLGKSMVPKIRELVDTGELSIMTELITETPVGVVDMLKVKGIGPSKVRLLWKEMEIESIGELLYACNENRLVDFKGFGSKTQESIKKDIEFKISNTGRFHFASIEALAKEILLELSDKSNVIHASFTGEMRRKCQIIEKISFLVSTDTSIPEDQFYTHEIGLPIEIRYCSEQDYVKLLFELSAHESHLDLIQYKTVKNINSEKGIYKELNLAYIIPEMREGRDELVWSEKNKIEEIVDNKDLKGILHNHSTLSDGQNSILEMAHYCIENGYEYFGISDHSKTAFYANGLQVDRIKKQWEEIDALNETLAPFKIFKGIESDILYDGSLDYPDEILKGFDFIVASIHSQLKMDEKKSMERLLAAIQNPYTTILGHLTSRLLLSREGYPVNHGEIIAACAEHNVSIELNANPLRLDMDWEWIYQAMEAGVPVSINPDAHTITGLSHMKYGVNVARKAGLLIEHTLNAKNLKEIEDYFRNK